MIFFPEALSRCHSRGCKCFSIRWICTSPCLSCGCVVPGELWLCIPFCTLFTGLCLCVLIDRHSTSWFNFRPAFLVRTVAECESNVLFYCFLGILIVITWEEGKPRPGFWTPISCGVDSRCTLSLCCSGDLGGGVQSCLEDGLVDCLVSSL